MPDTGRTWPPVEKLVKDWLTARTTALVCTERPAGQAFGTAVETTGVVQLELAGGAGEVVDRQAVIEIRIYATTRAALLTLAGAVETAMQDLTADGTDDGFVDDVEETFLFAVEPHRDPGIRHATGTFTLTVRPM